ncbi:hypothetical protein HPP92_020014 [Vanilla planifolia]|uniref:Exocyst subunit Exo70 family protein n=1 Tax=Vanilla planifolia TaxID=51239 RepID=A0A835UMC0_VANPL|nr:hypothetical protein HPP92_020014 [Vanilla planifolia]
MAMVASCEVSEERGISNVNAKLGMMHRKIVNWDSDPSMIWDRDPSEASEFLQAVNEVQQFREQLKTSNVNKDLFCFADNTLQMAMARLEEEFVHLLIEHSQPLEPEQMSFHSSEDEFSQDLSSCSFEVDADQGKTWHESSCGSENVVVDLIHPNAIYDLRSIAEAMLLSNYDGECCLAYISIRKNALDECLSVVCFEKLGIEEVLRMDWAALNFMIRRWNRALKLFIRVYLTGEKRLCDLIFGEFSESLRNFCFFEISKISVMQFLYVAEAIIIRPRKPEKLFRILDMYESLLDLLPDIESLFPERSGSFILKECNELLLRLGECVRETFSEFKLAIRDNTSTTSFAGGGVHPLTRYVMNYIKTLAAYSGTLNILLDDQDRKNLYSLEEDGDGSSLISCNLLSVTYILESNLTKRSMLYRDSALQSFFIMNNVCYMVQKVKGSDLQAILGDDWIRAHNRMFRQHALNYERATWSPVLAFLKDDGIHSHGSSCPSKNLLKERFKSFNHALEEVYRIQTAWSIPNIELRDDLRISVSLKVLQATELSWDDMPAILME